MINFGAMPPEAAHLSDLRDASTKAAVEIAQRIIENVGLVLEGKRDVVQMAVTAMLARGHLLIEDVDLAGGCPKRNDG